MRVDRPGGQGEVIAPQASRRGSVIHPDDRECVGAPFDRESCVSGLARALPLGDVLTQRRAQLDRAVVVRGEHFLRSHFCQRRDAHHGLSIALV